MASPQPPGDPYGTVVCVEEQFYDAQDNNSIDNLTTAIDERGHHPQPYDDDDDLDLEDEEYISSPDHPQSEGVFGPFLISDQERIPGCPPHHPLPTHPLTASQIARPGKPGTSAAQFSGRNSTLVSADLAAHADPDGQFAHIMGRMSAAARLLRDSTPMPALPALPLPGEEQEDLHHNNQRNRKGGKQGKQADTPPRTPTTPTSGKRLRSKSPFPRAMPSAATAAGLPDLGEITGGYKRMIALFCYWDPMSWMNAAPMEDGDQDDNDDDDGDDDEWGEATAAAAATAENAVTAKQAYHRSKKSADQLAATARCKEATETERTAADAATAAEAKAGEARQKWEGAEAAAAAAQDHMLNLQFQRAKRQQERWKVKLKTLQQVQKEAKRLAKVFRETIGASHVVESAMPYGLNGHNWVQWVRQEVVRCVKRKFLGVPENCAPPSPEQVAERQALVRKLEQDTLLVIYYGGDLKRIELPDDIYDYHSECEEDGDGDGDDPHNREMAELRREEAEMAREERERDRKRILPRPKPRVTYRLCGARRDGVEEYIDDETELKMDAVTAQSFEAEIAFNCDKLFLFDCPYAQALLQQLIDPVADASLVFNVPERDPRDELVQDEEKDVEKNQELHVMRQYVLNKKKHARHAQALCAVEADCDLEPAYAGKFTRALAEVLELTNSGSSGGGSGSRADGDRGALQNVHLRNVAGLYDKLLQPDVASAHELAPVQVAYCNPRQGPPINLLVHHPGTSLKALDDATRKRQHQHSQHRHHDHDEREHGSSNSSSSISNNSSSSSKNSSSIESKSSRRHHVAAEELEASAYAAQQATLESIITYPPLCVMLRIPVSMRADAAYALWDEWQGTWQAEFGQLCEPQLEALDVLGSVEQQMLRVAGPPGHEFDLDSAAARRRRAGADLTVARTDEEMLETRYKTTGTYLGYPRQGWSCVLDIAVPAVLWELMERSLPLQISVWDEGETRVRYDRQEEDPKNGQSSTFAQHHLERK